jgi:hypothetical protein
MSTASARVTVNVARVGLQAPAQAAAAGYTRLVFQEEFDDTSGIDMADTRQPGFNFYRNRPFGYGAQGGVSPNCRPQEPDRCPGPGLDGSGSGWHLDRSDRIDRGRQWALHQGPAAPRAPVAPNRRRDRAGPAAGVEHRAPGAQVPAIRLVQASPLARVLEARSRTSLFRQSASLLVPEVPL